MNKLFTALLLFFGSLGLMAQDDDIYKYEVDLNEVIADQVKISLQVPSSVPKDEVTFYFPRIIPGTYEIHDYGQFINNLEAFDSRGKKLKVNRIDKNTWKIKKAKRLEKITYLVEDIWDAKLKAPLFEPACTNFEAGKVFFINNNGLFGFFEDKEKLKFELTFNRPNDFYASTSLRRTGGDFDTDVFRASDYGDLVDAPILYSNPDTVNFKLGYGDIQISVYSPNKKATAKDIADKIRPMLEAQNKYLGNMLPVDRYHFLIYLSPNGYPSGSIGALEHPRSSMFCLAEEKVDRIGELVVNIASHEFFHIVTPLYIQSEEIYNFNYMNPKMSKHLWLYEGVVEYMAHHMQCQYGLKTQEEFMDKLCEKVQTSTRYKAGIPLAEMSKKCLEKGFNSQYNNIYYKGALTAMCFDLELIRLSEGQYDLTMLLRDLSAYYGQDNPFQDVELYDKIIEITGFPQLQKFFDKYVEGTEMLDYNKFLEPYGVEYFKEAPVLEMSPLGGLENGALRTDTLGRFYMAKAEKLDEFGSKYMGLKNGDVILSWNDKSFTPKTASAILFTYMQGLKVGDPLEIRILRPDGEGNYKEMTLETEIAKIKMMKKHVFKIKEKMTEEQEKRFKRWLEPQIR